MGVLMELFFRRAKEADLPGLVQLLADDELGAGREDTSTPLNPRYTDAFRAIERNGGNELIVVHSGVALVGMLQLSFVPYLTHTGSWRCMIEGVRISREWRGAGLGSAMINWAIDQARERGCKIVQLTSDKRRPDAIRFYETLGFQATHEGFKLAL